MKPIKHNTLWSYNDSKLRYAVGTCIRECKNIPDPKVGASLAWKFYEEFCSKGCKYSAALGVDCPKDCGRECHMEALTLAVCEEIADREDKEAKIVKEIKDNIEKGITA